MKGRLPGMAAPDGGAELMDADREAGLRRAEIGDLVGGPVEYGWGRRGEGAPDGGTGQHLDLVGLAILAERHLALPAVAADPGAADPAEGHALRRPRRREM